MDAFDPDLAVALVGLLVGAASTWSGLGAGLALPVLAVFGMPLSATLLAVKLPVAASDLAAGFLPARASAGEAQPTRAMLLLALVAGALGALALLRLPGELAMAGVMALALWAWSAPAGPRPGGLLAWGSYIGACGVGAGWLRRARAWRRGDDWQHGERAARQLAGAANVGAVVVLVASGQGAEGPIALLAAAQAVGAWSVVAWRGAARQRPPAAMARSS